MVKMAQDSATGEPENIFSLSFVILPNMLPNIKFIYVT